MPEKPPVTPPVPEPEEKAPGWMTLDELNAEIDKLQREIKQLEQDVTSDPHVTPDTDGYVPGKVRQEILFRKQTRLAGCIISRDAILGKADGGTDQYAE